MPLRFGLIGLGYFGKNYLRLLQEIPGVELVAIASRTGAHFAHYADQIPAGVRTTTDVASVLRDPSIDCIAIVTPPSTHFALAKQALDAGKHVLVEKPMVTKLADALSLKEIADRAGKILMVGHQYVYNDHVRALKSEITSHALGEIQYVFAEQFSFLRTEDVGCLWEMATHELSMIDFLFGPKKIIDARGRMYDFDHDGKEDFVACEIVFDTGLPVTLVASSRAPEKVRRMTIGGVKAHALFDDVRQEGKLQIVEQAKGSRQDFIPPASRTVEISSHEPLKNELLHFLECIRTGAEPQTGITNGVKITEWLDTLNRTLA